MTNRYALCLGIAIVCLLGCGESATALPTHGETNVQEEVVFVSRGVKLAGTIVHPQGDGPFPAIAITHGSGRERRSPYIRSFANDLADAGFAILIWDKRGIGESEGEYVEQPKMDVPIDDLLAAVEILRSKTYVDPSKVGVFGHSQGGWTVSIAAAKSEHVAFVISSCGGGSAVFEQVAFQRSEMQRAKGSSDKEVKEMRAFLEQMMMYFGTGDGYEKADAAYRLAKSEKWFETIEEWGWFGDDLWSPETIEKPAFEFFRTAQFHPAETEQAIKVPTLAIFGAVDVLVDTKGASKRWQDNFAASGNDDLTIKVVEGMGHGPAQRAAGSISMKPAYKKILLEWLKQFTD